MPKPILLAGDIPTVEWVHKWPDLRIDEIKTIEKMTIQVLDLTNLMMSHLWHFHKISHRINSDYREGDDGEHGKGNALDVVLFKSKPGDIHCIIQYCIANQFDFGGLGFYPFWKTPGIHIDCREKKNPRSTWWADIKGRYHSIDEISDFRAFLNGGNILI